MTEVYLLQNEHGLCLSKQMEWNPDTPVASLYQTTYKDEAINTRVEITVKTPEARISIIKCALNDKGLPILPEPSKD